MTSNSLDNVEGGISGSSCLNELRLPCLNLHRVKGKTGHPCAQRVQQMCDEPSAVNTKW